MNWFVYAAVGDGTDFAEACWIPVRTLDSTAERQGVSLPEQITGSFECLKSADNLEPVPDEWKGWFTGKLAAQQKVKR